MARYLLFVLAFFPSVAVAQLNSAKPATVGVSSEGLASLSAYLQELVNDNQVAGGVVMMVRHNKVVFHQAVGQMDREEEPVDC